jgi:hypothetical protein
MSNSKAIGAAYSDPQFDSLEVTGASTLAAVTAFTVAATGAVTAPSFAATGAVTGASLASTTTSGAVASNASGGVYFLTTAITNNVTTTTAPEGSLGLTSNATGTGILFVSDGSKWQLAAITQA